jgi:hypothetical protein
MAPGPAAAIREHGGRVGGRPDQLDPHRVEARSERPERRSRARQRPEVRAVGPTDRLAARAGVDGDDVADRQAEADEREHLAGRQVAHDRLAAGPVDRPDRPGLDLAGVGDVLRAEDAGRREVVRVVREPGRRGRRRRGEGDGRVDGVRPVGVRAEEREHRIVPGLDACQVVALEPPGVDALDLADRAVRPGDPELDGRRQRVELGPGQDPPAHGIEQRVEQRGCRRGDLDRDLDGRRRRRDAPECRTGRIGQLVAGHRHGRHAEAVGSGGDVDARGVVERMDDTGDVHQREAEAHDRRGPLRNACWRWRRLASAKTLSGCTP